MYLYDCVIFTCIDKPNFHTSTTILQLINQSTVRYCKRLLMAVVCVYVSGQAIKKKNIFIYTQIKPRNISVEGDEMSDRWGWLSWLQVLAALQFVALLAVCSRWDADVHHVVSRRLVVSRSVSDLLLWYDAINFYRCRRNGERTSERMNADWCQ